MALNSWQQDLCRSDLLIISRDLNVQPSYLLRASFEDYDGIAPAREFLVDANFGDVSQEYVALASYLVFGSWASGSIAFPDAITAELATAIEDDSAPIRIRPQGVNLIPKAIRPNSKGVDICLGGAGGLEQDHLVEILPYGFNSGNLCTPHKTQISSNAFIFSRLVPCQKYMRPIIAATLLGFGADPINSLLLSVRLEKKEVSKLHALLQSVGIRLIAVD